MVFLWFSYGKLLECYPQGMYKIQWLVDWPTKAISDITSRCGCRLSHPAPPNAQGSTATDALKPPVARHGSKALKPRPLKISPKRKDTKWRFKHRSLPYIYINIYIYINGGLELGKSSFGKLEDVPCIELPSRFFDHAKRCAPLVPSWWPVANGEIEPPTSCLTCSPSVSP